MTRGFLSGRVFKLRMSIVDRILLFCLVKELGMFSVSKSEFDSDKFNSSTSYFLATTLLELMFSCIIFLLETTKIDACCQPFWQFLQLISKYAVLLLQVL